VQKPSFLYDCHRKSAFVTSCLKIRTILLCRLTTSGEFLSLHAMLLGLFSKHDPCIVSSWKTIPAAWDGHAVAVDLNPREIVHWWDHVFWGQECVLLCFINPRVRKIGNEA